LLGGGGGGGSGRGVLFLSLLPIVLSCSEVIYFLTKRFLNCNQRIKLLPSLSDRDSSSLSSNPERRQENGNEGKIKIGLAEYVLRF